MNVSKIPSKDKAILRDFYESDMYRVFKKYFLDQRQLDVAQECTFSPSMEQLKYNQGRVVELLSIHKDLKSIAKRDRNEEAKSAKST